MGRYAHLILTGEERTIDPTPEKAQVRAYWLTLERWAGPGLSIGALLLYARTLSPSVGGTVDSPEFQQAAYSLSVAHPTGYPLYLLLGRLWLTIFPFGDVAYRMNFLSALFAALAVWVLYALVRQVTSNAPVSIAAAALFAVQGIPWSQASVAEINTLNTLLVGLTFLAFVLWAGGRLPLPLAALTLGLAASHHRTVLLYVVPLAIYAIFAVRQGRIKVARRSQLGLSLLLALLPFAAYAYLPLRAHTTPWYTNTWEGFVRHVGGESALSAIGSALSRSLPGRFRLLLADQMFRGAEGLLLLGLGLLGVAVLLLVLVLRRRSTGRNDEMAPPASYLDGLRLAPAMLCVAAALLGTGFAAIYDIQDIYEYLAVPVFMWSVLVGAGFLGLLAFLESALSKVAAPNRLRRIIAPSVVLLVAVLLFTATGIGTLARRDIRVDYSKLDRQSYWLMVKEMLAAAPPGTILVGDWYELNETLYFQRTEGWRPDLVAAPLDSAVTAEGAQVDRWLEEGRQVYLLGQYGQVLQRFAADVRGPTTFGSEVRGPLWQIIGRRTEEAPPDMAHRADRRFGNSIVLVGYTFEPAEGLKPGDLLKLTLYWQATERIYERYTVFNHVLDNAGIKVAQKDDEPQRGVHPTVLWQPGETIVDTLELPISSDAKAGSYRLVTGMYNSVTQERLKAYNPDGSELGDYAVLAEITLVAP